MTTLVPLEQVALALPNPDAAGWHAELARRGLRFRVDRQWPTTLKAIPDAVGPVLTSSRGDSWHRRIVEYDDGLLWVVLQPGSVMVTAAATDEPIASAMLDATQEHLPLARPDTGQVPVRFWVDAVNGPQDTQRRLDMPEWDAIAANYPTDTREALDALTRRGDPPPGGRLVLWHGPPGTGKTTALRALVRAWEPWSRASCLTDPEAFLFDPAYLQHVLLQVPSRRRTQLILLEDSGDLLRAQNAGHGLARLLNLTDGLLGQGLRVLVLATTNTPPGDLDPALSRPGRCAAEIAFEPFGADAAADWLRTHDVDAPRPDGERTLADLYALAEGRETPTPARRPVGFAPG